MKLLLVADLEYPRSKAYRSVDSLTAAVYAAVAGSADATYWPADARAGEHDVLARACMDAIDRDRTLSAAEAGYDAAFTTMEDDDEEVAAQEEAKGAGAGGSEAPLANAAAAAGAGLKNQLLLGWRRGKAEASASSSAAAAPAAAAASSASRCGSST